MPHGLCFVNCHNNDGAERSGIAFYNDYNAGTNNLNQQPDAFVYTDLVGDTHWESNDKQRATFSSNVTVVWQIEVDAQSKSADAVVGSADNGFQSFTIHKDTERLLATNADGFQMFTVYYAV